MVDLEKIAKALKDPDEDANGWVCCANPQDLDAMLAELTAARRVVAAARTARSGLSSTWLPARALDAAISVYDDEVHP